MTKARKPGPAAPLFKVKAAKEPGVCQMRGCSSRSVTERSKWCYEHKRVVRKAQLALNNIVWRKRVERGTAGHHVAYKNRPTVWAATHVRDAERLVRKGRSIYGKDAWMTKVVPRIPTVLRQLAA